MNKMKKSICMSLAIIFLFSQLMMTSCSLSAPRKFLDVDVHSPFRLSTWLLYVPNRVMDVLDVVSVGATLGLGLYLKVQPTRLIKFVYPLPAGVLKVGWNTHYLEEMSPKNPLYIWKRYKPVCFGLEGKKSIPFLGFIELGDMLEIKTSPDEIKIGAHILLVGADVGIRPVDILDVVTGFFFIDLNNDDLRFEKKSD